MSALRNVLKGRVQANRCFLTCNGLRNSIDGKPCIGLPIRIEHAHDDIFHGLMRAEHDSGGYVFDGKGRTVVVNNPWWLSVHSVVPPVIECWPENCDGGGIRLDKIAIYIPENYSSAHCLVESAIISFG